MEERQEVEAPKVCGTCIYRVTAGGRFVCASLKSGFYGTAVKATARCDRWKKNKRSPSIEEMVLEQRCTP